MSNDFEKHYRDCACRSNTPFFCERLHKISTGHEENLDRQAYRTVYQHDRDKIVYSHSFRRLRLKTQIFPEHTSDLLRTRLDHTIEVAQIGRHISRQLLLNEDLVDAMALAHDLGHTPFAHSGERALHNYLYGVEDKEKIVKFELRGFKHNWQGLRVVDFIEKSYPGVRGINLSNAVRLGILLHTGLRYKNKKDQICDCYMSSAFGDKTNLESKQYNIFEIQILKISDEIAGLVHDIEDALVSKSISYLEYWSGDGILQSELLRQCKDRLIGKGFKFPISDLCNEDSNSLLLSRMRSELIYILTNDIILESRKRLEEWERRTIRTPEDLKYFVNQKESFPDIIKLYKYFDDFYKLKNNLEKNIILSERISRMDAKAAYIIRKILDLYRHSPRQVPDNVFQNYFSLKQRNYENVRLWSDSELSSFNNDELYIRSLVDYVSGMTDRYALREYDILYSAYPRAEL